MGRAKASPLDVARKESPPPNRCGRPSRLDREEIHAILLPWLKAKAAGKHADESFDWFAREVLPRLGVTCTGGNLRRHCEARWPALYAKASR